MTTIIMLAQHETSVEEIAYIFTFSLTFILKETACFVHSEMFDTDCREITEGAGDSVNKCFDNYQISKKRLLNAAKTLYCMSYPIPQRGNTVTSD